MVRDDLEHESMTQALWRYGIIAPLLHRQPGEETQEALLSLLAARTWFRTDGLETSVSGETLPRPKPAPSSGPPQRTVARPAPPPPQPTSSDLSRGQRAGVPSREGLIRIDIEWEGEQDLEGRFDVRTAAFLLHADNLVADADGFISDQNRSGGQDCISMRRLKSDPRLGCARFDLRLQAVPAPVVRLVFAITLHDGFKRGQRFSQIPGLSIRFHHDGKDLFRYRLKEDVHDATTIRIGELYRHQDEWKFMASGLGLTGGMDALCREFGLKMVRVETGNKGFRRLDRDEGDVRFVARRDLERSTELIRNHLQLHIAMTGWGVFDFKKETVPLDIYINEPTTHLNRHTLVTLGMSHLTSTGQATELLLCLPRSWQFTPQAMKEARYHWPLTLLRNITAMPAFREHTLLPGTLIKGADLGMNPMGTGHFTGVLIHFPTLYPDLEELAINDRKIVHFLSVIPIYEEEMEYGSEQGSEALFRRLIDAGINEEIHLERTNTCKKKTSWFRF